MNQNQLLIQTLQQFHSVAWINQYFDLLRKLLIELNLENDDPRLALSLNSNKTIPVNIGQRYALKPVANQYVRCIVPSNFAEEAVGARLLFYFSARTKRDAKWIEVLWPVGKPFPPVLYN